MHEFLIKRTVDERIFKRLHKVINSLLDAGNTTFRIIEKRLREFNERWIKLQEAHDFYVISCFTDAKDVDEQDKFIETFSTDFYTTESRCESYLTIEKNASHVNENSETAFKIERFKFPIFDGHVRKYAKFKYEFEKFVKPLCSPSQLPFALKTYLCDSVRSDVENCDHNVEEMWRRLDQKYGTKQKLIDNIISDIKRLPQCTSNPQQLLRMINTIEAANNDLKCVNANEELNNATIISMIEQRMSTAMHDE